MKIVVIGGVAAGMSAASKARRLDPQAEIIVFEKGNHLSYGACGLPYYVSNVNNDINRMIIRTEEAFNKQGIMTFLHHEVTYIDVEKKNVMVRNLETGNVFVETYDQLVITTGARPFKPNIKGVNLPEVMTLKTLEDGCKMKEALSSDNIKNVAIVGAGYIGIEVAEAMVELGKNVQIIELADRILLPFDSEISEYAYAELEKSGVKIRLKEKVIKICGEEKVTGIETDKGHYQADFIVMAVGVVPNTRFLKNTGIELTKNGAICIDREMRTKIPNIYAAGDCAMVYHKGKEENAYIALGTTANKCGRIIGTNLCGGHQKYVGTLASSAIKVLNLELGRTGLSEKEARELFQGIEVKVVKTYNCAPYYKNQEEIVIKLIYEKRTRRILGAQAVGKQGVVLRIDIFATAIHNHMTSDELGMVDFCYAPPFSGVWDAVHVAANAVK